MLTEAWQLSGSVSLRPERFGALAYDFRTRRLSFLKTPTLVDVVRRLGDSPTVLDALTGAGVDASQQAAYVKALSGLATSGLLVLQHPSPSAPVSVPAASQEGP
jgi:putative mycofactocin binding protein MftB